jgi:flagellar assembly protein FliH
MSNATPFAFQTEFTPAGDVLGAPKTKFVTREEAEKLAVSARIEAETKVKQTVEAKGFASVDRIVAHLAPVSAQLAQIADTLRREAAELALTAAKKIAGEALDKVGNEAATAAIAETIRMLKGDPMIVVTLAPEALPEVERRMDQLRRQGQGMKIAFVANPNAKPGDWLVQWGEGSAGFSRDHVEATIDATVNARLADPVEPQLELFSAA